MKWERHFKNPQILLSRPTVNKYSGFPLEVLAMLWELVSKQKISEAAILKLAGQRGLVNATSFRLKNLQVILHPPHDQQNSGVFFLFFVFQAIIYFTIFGQKPVW